MITATGNCSSGCCNRHIPCCRSAQMPGGTQPNLTPLEVVELMLGAFQRTNQDIEELSRLWIPMAISQWSTPCRRRDRWQSSDGPSEKSHGGRTLPGGHRLPCCTCAIGRCSVTSEQMWTCDSTAFGSAVLPRCATRRVGCDLPMETYPSRLEGRIQMFSPRSAPCRLLAGRSIEPRYGEWEVKDRLCAERCPDTFIMPKRGPPAEDELD